MNFTTQYMSAGLKMWEKEDVERLQAISRELTNQMLKKNMKAIIKQTRQTKILQGMFRTRMFWFVLVGDNGEVISTGETVSQKHNVVEVLERYFPQFDVEDTTPITGGRQGIQELIISHKQLIKNISKKVQESHNKT